MKLIVDSFVRGPQEQRRIAVFEAVNKERDFQDAKYGNAYFTASNEQGPGGHELPGWILIMEAELAEAKRAITHGGMQTAKGRDSVRAEILQVITVGVAALEQHGVEEL